MNLTNYPPYRLIENFDKLLSQTLRNLDSTPAIRAPGVYRYEEKESYRLRLDLPGFTREEISLSLEKRNLTITATTKRKDPFHQAFGRTYSLPENVDPEGIQAKLQNGVLDLTFKKVTQTNNVTRNIEIS